MASPALLGVDWGTSTLRAALLDAHGGVLRAMSAPRGLLHITPGQWPTEFDALLGPWLAAHPGLPTLMCGMVGSRQGWLEAPYADVPAMPADLAAQLAWVRPGQVAIVPGLWVAGGGLPDAAPDVMRGEETQVFGALQALGLQQQAKVTLVLPGTHSKWVQVQHGRITGFATHMTGETYALLRRQSILSRLLPEDDQGFDGEGFDAGVAVAQQPGGLLHHAFGVRTLALLGRRSGPWLASHLSGLLVGEELRAQAVHAAWPAEEPLVLVGSVALTARYHRALLCLGLPGAAMRRIGEEATWAGLAALAKSLAPTA